MENNIEYINSCINNHFLRYRIRLFEAQMNLLMYNYFDEIKLGNYEE